MAYLESAIAYNPGLTVSAITVIVITGCVLLLLLVFDDINMPKSFCDYNNSCCKLILFCKTIYSFHKTGQKEYRKQIITYF